MRRARFALACLVIACSDSSAPNHPEIAGDWRADAVMLDVGTVNLDFQFARPLQQGAIGTFTGTGHLVAAADDTIAITANGTRDNADVTFGMFLPGFVLYSFDGAFVGANTIEGTFTKNGMADAPATFRRP